MFSRKNILYMVFVFILRCRAVAHNDCCFGSATSSAVDSELGDDVARIVFRACDLSVGQTAVNYIFGEKHVFSTLNPFTIVG